jgi:hypothetical protein
MTFFGLLASFLVGGPMSRGDLIERAPLGFHPNVGVS